MIFTFKTNTDINGNTYYLWIDTEAHEWSNFDRTGEERITVTRRMMREIRETAKSEGYKEI